MGLIDIRRFSVASHIDRWGDLVVGEVRLADEAEWDVDLAEVVKVNALATPTRTYRVMQNELRLLLSFLSDQPGEPLAMRHREFKGSAGHIKSFVSESFGLGMLTAAVERHYRWSQSDGDLANFDVLPARLAGKYPASGVRPDLLFDFRIQGDERRLAGEARGRSSSRAKSVNKVQRDRLDKIVAWSGRNDCHPVTMTWAFSGAGHVQVDLFDVQKPENTDERDRGMAERRQIKSPRRILDYEQPEFIRARALSRAATLANELYRTAPQNSPRQSRQIFARNVRGDWAMADLLAPSGLQFFLGVLDRALDRQQAGRPRQTRGLLRVGDADPIQIAATQRMLVIVARGSGPPPDWSEITHRIEYNQ